MERQGSVENGWGLIAASAEFDSTLTVTSCMGRVSLSFSICKAQITLSASQCLAPSISSINVGSCPHYQGARPPFALKSLPSFSDSIQKVTLSSVPSLYQAHSHPQCHITPLLVIRKAEMQQGYQ